MWQPCISKCNQNRQELAASSRHSSPTPFLNIMRIYTLPLVAVLTGSQAWPCTFKVWCGCGDQWHSGRKEAAGLQDGDHRWCGGAHSHSGNKERAAVALMMSTVCINEHCCVYFKQRQTVQYGMALASSTTLCFIWYIWTWQLHDCQCDTENSYDETFQNESEEPEGKERKGTRPGVVRCSYCVKQGNVVSTHSLLISSVFVD